MHIVVVGLNYRTAPVEVREQFAFADKDLPAALHQLLQTKSVLEGVVVATCNRTEIYVVVGPPSYVRIFHPQLHGAVVRSKK